MSCELNMENPIFNLCVGVWVGGHHPASFQMDKRSLADCLCPHSHKIFVCVRPKKSLNWPSTFKIFENYPIFNINLGLKFSYHWLLVKFMRWLASMARSLQFQFKLKHFLCWKCPRGWTRPLSNHKQPKSEPKLHLTFHLMENLLWLLRQGEFDLFPVYFRYS